MVKILKQRVNFVKFIFNRRYLYKLIIVLFLSASASLISSCSKVNDAPQPPHLKAQLVSELFSALKQENYEMASNRIDRLRELDPDDVALQSIQINIQNNLVMQRVQAELDKGEIDTAIKIIDDFSVKNGQTSDLRDAVRELTVLKDIKVSISNAVSQYNSNSRFSNIPQDGSNPLQPRVISQEETLALENLKADIDTAWVMGDENLDTLLAILEVANPVDSLVTTYRKSMSEDWNKFDISTNYLNINTEVLTFRILASSFFENKNLLKKIASFEPNNYRDMLAKSIMLNITGNVEKSNAMLSSMKNELNAQDNIYKSWFTLTLKNSSFSKLNPLIVNPFFIYYNQNAIIKAQ